MLDYCFKGMFWVKNSQRNGVDKLSLIKTITRPIKKCTLLLIPFKSISYILLIHSVQKLSRCLCTESVGKNIGVFNNCLLVSRL